MKGSYLLVIKKENDSIIRIGKFGEIDFKKGYFMYVGSALNGLEQRIQRHLRIHKKTHWHIDYLLTHAKILNVFYKENDIKEECIIAKELEKQLDFIPGFGCSDCTCKSHLFYGTYNEIKHITERSDVKSYSCDAKY